MTQISGALIKSDLIMAQQAIRYYEENKFKDVKNQAAYHIQQAAEKLIKIQIYEKLPEVDNRSMYTHSLDKLIRYAQSENLEIKVPDYISKKRSMITDWEAGSRYDVSFSIKINTLKQALNEVNQWYNVVCGDKRHRKPNRTE